MVNCGGPSDHTTTPFSFPAPTEASPTTKRSLTFGKSLLPSPDRVSIDLFQRPTLLRHWPWRPCVPSRRKLVPAMSSKHVTILIESCKSADNLGNYCRNAFAVNFNFCLTDLISFECKNNNKFSSGYCTIFWCVSVSLRTKQSTSRVLSRVSCL